MKDEKYLNKIITTGHVALILQTHDRQARRVMNRIRKHFGKERHNPLLMRDFLEYTGLSIDYAFATLNWAR